MKKRALQAIKKKQVFIFHYRGGHLTRQIVETILVSIKEAVAEKSMYPKMSLNLGQGVFQVSFHKVAPTDTCVIEDANEGERT